jgi:copper homeostasis protein (lipoprotein)
MSGWPLLRLALVALALGTACGTALAAGKEAVDGTASFAGAVEMPPGAVFEATLEDVSRMDAAADVIAATRVENAGSPPYHFRLEFDATRIIPSRRYVVRARVTLSGRLLFTSTEAYPVITNSSPTQVEIALRQVGGAMGRVTTGGPGDLFATLPATFTGTLPCADCEGIAMQLNILPDASFMLRTRYLGRKEEGPSDDLGGWVPSSDGITLVFKGQGQAPFYFAVEDAGTLRMLDVSGSPFESPLDYDLRRNDTFMPIEPALSMRGMFTYMADAASFAECLTGRRLPVAMQGGYIDLERAYLAARTGPGEAVLARVEGRLAMRPPMEGDGLVPTLVVERFIGLAPGEQCPPRFQAAPLEGTRWTLAFLAGEAVVPVAGQSAPELLLSGDERRLSGFDGCNRLLAGYAQQGEAISISQVASTMRACEEGAEMARSYARALAEASRWRILGRQLELYDAKGRLLARFDAAIAP